jgi:nucleotide-binding universal stress UspA family protein
LDKHTLNYRCVSVVGHPVDEILKAAEKQKSHLIVMGTRGHGLIGRALIGSIAQRVVSDCDVPVLLVK